LTTRKEDLPVSTVAGPDFIALQVRDIERAAEFYERELGLARHE
jgi:catechol-2,3-dioxygenase